MINERSHIVKRCRARQSMNSVALRKHLLVASLNAYAQLLNNSGLPISGGMMKADG